MRFLMVMMLTAGCGPTSYGSAASARPLGPNRWIVEIHGNKRTGPSVILEYVNRKAGELCPDGYAIEQSSGGIETTGYIATNSTVVPIQHADSASVVQCTGQ